MIDYPDYKKPEGSSEFLKLKDYLRNEGDEIQLECLGARIIDAKDTHFGCSELELKVRLNQNEYTLNVDAPDEKNDFQGSQVYRGVKDNNIQPGDTFFIGHGGRMNNKYKTVIYGISKDVTEPAPEDTPEIQLEDDPY